MMNLNRRWHFLGVATLGSPAVYDCRTETPHGPTQWPDAGASLTASYGDDHHFFSAARSLEHLGAFVRGGTCGEDVIDQQNAPLL